MKNNEHNEIEHRIKALEDSIVEIRKSNLEGHKWFTTVMFTLVAVLLTVLGIVSKSDVREAIRDMKSDMRDTSSDMQSKLNTETDELEKKFAALSGEALKKPLLTISIAQGPLDGQVLEMSNGGSLPIYPLFLKNEGDKRTDPLSIRLYCSADISLNNGGNWQRVANNDKDYPVSYYLLIESRAMGIGVAPKETWSLPDDYYGGQAFLNTTNIVNCKLLVFYGAEQPAEAKFIIKLK